MSRKEEKKLPAYMREQGNRQAKEPRKRKITFSFSQHLEGTGGQSGLYTLLIVPKPGLYYLVLKRFKYPLF